MKLSAKTLAALQIIRAHPGIQPREFARLMWPDSDGFRRSSRCGRGSSRGGGMNLAGGGYLGRLRRCGLITWDQSLTEAGLEALESPQKMCR